MSRADVRSLVLGQLGFSWWDLSTHLDGLTDEEYRWQPAPGALSVVRRSETTRRVTGAGEWVAEWPRGGTEWTRGDDDPGVRTIGWLVTHLVEVFAERWEWTFGGHRLRRDDIEVHPTAHAGVAALTDVVERWQRDLAALDAGRFWTVGLSQATEIDAQAPFAHLVLHVNRELVHHGAEICVLRDLHRVRAG